MAAKKKKNHSGERYRQIAQNRKARHNYFIDEKYEAGLVLTGTEVKSLREGHANIQESYAAAKEEEMWLYNSYIAEYAAGSRENHEPRRPRKLLLRRREIDKIAIACQREGMTVVPLALYFNDRGIAKLQIGLARGKKQYDKRQTEKTRDWNRQKARILRDRG